MTERRDYFFKEVEKAARAALVNGDRAELSGYAYSVAEQGFVMEVMKWMWDQKRTGDITIRDCVDYFLESNDYRCLTTQIERDPVEDFDNIFIVRRPDDN